MSHGDSIVTLPKGFSIAGSTANTAIAAVVNKKKNLYGLQFHPEVEHTAQGTTMLRNFLFTVCGCQETWDMKSFAKDAIAQVQDTVGDQKVILGLSGGVDSSVSAVLINKAIGQNLTCIFVDNGLLRKDEAIKLKKILRQHLNIKIRFVSARNLFLKALSKITDPEKKRKIIGKVFMDVFETEARKIKGVGFLAQGTLYPDVIESVIGLRGPLGCYQVPS